MRVQFANRTGNLTIEHCVLLRFNENGSVRKFYQQMLLQFVNDGAGVSIRAGHEYWSMSNWGPLAEASWTGRHGHCEIKGGLKTAPQASMLMAQEANRRQIAAKMKGGYTHYSEFTAGAGIDPTPKMLSEIGATKMAPTSGQGWTSGMTPQKIKATLRPGTPQPAFAQVVVNENLKAHLKAHLQAAQNATSALSTLAMNELNRGDVGAAVGYRRDLMNLLEQFRTLQESAEGQLEMLTLRLTKELKG